MAEGRFEYIEDARGLVDAVEDLAGSRVLAIDTEFIREKTYYPNLCLIQLASDDSTFLIDPFTIDDLSILSILLEDDRTVKLLHSGHQDLEILLHATGVLPKRVFDVQIAASILGQTQQAGLGSLISAFLGKTIKKGDSFTDWSMRPLAGSQLEYAAEDVIYLPALYDVMTERLAELGRSSWLDDEFEALVDPSRYEEDPLSRYRRLSKVNQLNRKQMAAAREVAAWREMRAMEHDIPRRWVLTDEQIVESCKREPQNLDELFMVRGMRKNLSTRDARHVLSLMQRAYSSDPSTWPENRSHPSQERNVDGPVNLMTALVRMRSKQEGIAMQTIASHSDLVDLARGHMDDSPLMRGWRRDVVGNELIELLEGRISMRIVDGELETTGI